MFVITFTKTVRATVEIDAKSEAEARKKFDSGEDWDNEKDLEAFDVELESIEAEE